MRFAEKTIGQLRDEMSHKALEMRSNSISGGRMGGYLEEGWPLYFVNEKMPDHLGYTYDVFVRETGSPSFGSPRGNRETA